MYLRLCPNAHHLGIHPEDGAVSLVPLEDLRVLRCRSTSTLPDGDDIAHPVGCWYALEEGAAV